MRADTTFLQNEATADREARDTRTGLALVYISIKRVVLSISLPSTCNPEEQEIKHTIMIGQQDDAAVMPHSLQPFKSLPMTVSCDWTDLLQVSASEVATVWRYTNLFIIILIIIF